MICQVDCKQNYYELSKKKYTPVGSNSTKVADLRFIAATNKNLEEEVKKQNFRLDLYYRLNVLPISLPPLRERTEDIPLLIEHFLEQVNRTHKYSQSAWLNDELIEELKTYSWPGNVRQLENLIERLAVLKGGGKIELEDLPEEIKTSRLPPKDNQAEPARISQCITTDFHDAKNNTNTESSSFLQNLDGLCLPKYLNKIENSLIKQALEQTQYNKKKAADLLGLNRTTLVEKNKEEKDYLICKNGGEYRSRTGDLITASDALYQLS